MSHYTVAVFTDDNTNLEDLLAPYDEKIEVDKYIKYSKEDIINIGRKNIKNLMKLYIKYLSNKQEYRRKHLDNINHLRFIKKVPEMNKWNSEKIYKYVIKQFPQESISSDGGVYSTYNPNSKWDWYQIGGRWKNLLIINDPENESKTKHVNSAKIKDIRWDLMIKESENEYRKTDKEYFEKIYNTNESYRKKYKTLENIINSICSFNTYAVLTPDGKWHEPGPMGWWGISEASIKEINRFEEKYNETFIKNANPEWTLTIVDCHI